MSEEQQMPEYKQGDNVRLTVELRDQNGVGQEVYEPLHNAYRCGDREEAA